MIRESRVLRGRLLAVGCAAVAIATWPSIAHAGMPGVDLTDLAEMRLQSISFFLAVFLVSAWGIKVLWNWLRHDFVRLPRLTYPKALALVALWGFLFVLVLTMISGARELMTPGAWEKSGLTYRLTKEDAAALDSERARRFDALRAALLQYAAAHDGALPQDEYVTQIPATLWETPDLSRMRYVYRLAAASDPAAIVLYEPPIFPAPYRVMRRDGTVESLSRQELEAATRSESEDRP